MHVEIRTLTGPGQGTSQVFKSSRIRIGTAEDCDIRFNAVQIPEAIGRCAEIQLTKDGWMLNNVGTGEIRVNQEIVAISERIMPGDVIRFSENGPDFSFGVVRPETAVTKPFGDAGSDPITDDGIVDLGDPGSLGLQASQFVWRLLKKHPIVTVGAVVVLLLVLFNVLFGARDASKLPEPAPARVQIENIGPQEIAEQQPWKFEVPLLLENVRRSDVRFELSEDVPQGMQIDSEGRISWTPTESQSSREYRIRVVASYAQELQDTATIVVQVIKIAKANRPPVVTPIPQLVAKAVDNFKLNYQVQAKDPDTPSAKIQYALGPGAPEGMTIDSATGKIHWEPSEQQRGKSFAVIVKVAEQENPDVMMTVPFLVRSEEASPKMGIRDVMYVITLMDPQGQNAYAYASAIAIRSDVLVTTAAVAREIQIKKQKNWKINAVLGTSRTSEPVQEIFLHKVYQQLADEPQDQIYVDVAILRVADRKDRVTIELADHEEIDKLEVGAPLECMAIEHQGEPLTRFTDTQPKIFEARLRIRDSLVSETPSPQLLHLQAELPKRILGSAILDRRKRLCAIVAETASFPVGSKEATERGPLNGKLHYAPSLFLIVPWVDQQQGVPPDWEQLNLPESAKN